MNDGSILQAQSEQVRKERLMRDLLREVCDVLEAESRQLRVVVNAPMDRNTMRGAGLAAGPVLEQAARLLLAVTQGL